MDYVFFYQQYEEKKAGVPGQPKRIMDYYTMATPSFSVFFRNYSVSLRRVAFWNELRKNFSVASPFVAR